MIESAQEFVSLLESEDTSQKERIRYEDAPEKVWFEILENYPEYTSAVVLNKSVPLNVLRYLSKNPDSRVRWVVAMKRKLDMALFEELSSDPDDTVRNRIAYNKKTPKHVLERLANDPVQRVAEVAQKRIGDLENHE